MFGRSSTLMQVLVALGLALLLGGISKPDSQLLGIPYVKLFAFLGQLFLNALTLLVVPLVATSIVNGVGQIGKEASFRRLGGKTFFFYILTTFLGIMTGLFAINLLKPGSHFTSSAHLKPTEFLASPLFDQIVKDPWEILGHTLTKLIPVNIFEAASSGNMLGLVFFSLLFGLALGNIEASPCQSLLKIVEGAFSVFMKMTQYLVKIIPLGVFFLVTKIIAENGLDSLESLVFFVLTVLLALSLYLFGILPLLLRIMGINPWHHLHAMLPALITAFSTSSSAATLPITIDCVEKRAGVSNRICSFVIPLGTSVNMTGSALYECVAVLFIAQVYGIQLTLMHQAIIVVLSLITSFGVAGIPSTSLIAIVIILNTLGFPVEGLALILPVDRLLDMCRTTVNVFSDTSCAVLVAHTEGEAILKNRTP